jgi:hypothetical protein
MALEEEKFAADEAQRAFENGIKSSEKSTSVSTGKNEASDKKEATENKKVTPVYEADEFVNRIFRYYDETVYDWDKRDGLVKKAIWRILQSFGSIFVWSADAAPSPALQASSW